MADYPLYNGVASSWADVAVTVQGLDMPLLTLADIQAINTGSSVEVGEQRRGGRVIATTTGSGSSEAGMTLYRSGFQNFLRGLKKAAEGLGHVRGAQVYVSLVHFNVVVQHTPPGAEEILEVRIKGCRYLARTLNGSEGTDADLVEVTLNPKEVVDVIDGIEVSLL